ncbi:hypothetical protein ABIB06_002457 [Bradyrhizobium sp. LB8.2]|uniref:MAE_28990/MAE_18760 family HEPN-like nuclease n=1 Tax=unclassified Bradyrhizobium TaxID=2631580 RepID=UPI003390D6D2
MYEPYIERLARNIASIKKHLELSALVRSMISDRSISCSKGSSLCFDVGAMYASSPDPTDWKIIDHCSVVTRLYAVFERFVEDILGAHLQFLEANVAYDQLDEKFRSHHRKSVGQMLIDLDKDRYKDSITFNSILSDIGGIFRGERYRLLPEAMLSHDQNLRMKDLVSLFDRCGIPKLAEWIGRHRAIKIFFKGGRQSDKADAELDQLVQYRNEAAHGGIEVTDVLGTDILIEYADFVEALCSALAECVQRNCIARAEELGKTRRTGVITEIFSDRRVVAIVGGGTFKVSDRPYLCGEGFCYRATIESIHHDDSPVPSVTLLNDTEIGFALDVEPVKRALIYYY